MISVRPWGVELGQRLIGSLLGLCGREAKFLCQLRPMPRDILQEHLVD
jgi:hypothetical protein